MPAPVGLAARATWAMTRVPSAEVRWKSREPAAPAAQEGGLPGQGLGEAEQARLRRRVVGLPDVAHLADDRRDVDDAPAPPLRHVAQRGLREEERAGEIDVQHLEPVLVGE